MTRTQRERECEPQRERERQSEPNANANPNVSVNPNANANPTSRPRSPNRIRPRCSTGSTLASESRPGGAQALNPASKPFRDDPGLEPGSLHFRDRPPEFVEWDEVAVAGPGRAD